MLTRHGWITALVLCGCGRGSSGSESGAASSTPTVAAQPSLQSAVRQSPTTPTEQPAAFDEKFNPDGYYLPKGSLAVAGAEISSLELHTLDSYYDGQIHYLPRRVQPPDVRLVIKESPRNSDSGFICDAARILPDSLSLSCENTTVGNVAIEGHFLDKGPNFSDKFGDKETELLVARVLVSKNGMRVYDQVQRFVYVTGD
jgi:hypothetical protein